MHAISPYLLRCYNKILEGPREQRYSTLDNLGTNDLYTLYKEYVTQGDDSYKIIEDSKQVYRFESIVCDDIGREIYGWFSVGTYGMKTDIINIKTGKVDFQKAQDNAEIIRHYLHLFIPAGFNEAMCFLHSYRGVGVKTLFHALFAPYFQEKTKLVIQMNPLLYDKALNAWLEASAKEVRLTKFQGASDLADQIKLLGHSELELVIKPPRNLSLGKLKDYMTPGSQHLAVVEAIEGFGEKVKTVVELNGQKRTFTIGQNASNALCEIQFDDKIVMNEGNPDLDSTYTWVRQIIGEYAYHMYPGLKISELQ